MSRRLAVVSAGLSTPSSTGLLADQITGAVGSQIGARGEAASVTRIEVRQLATGLAGTVTSGGVPPPAVAEALTSVASADALVAVTPVFAGSYSGLFKLFFDALDPDALRGTPVLIAATAGSPRHSLMLDFTMRPLFTYLHAVVVPTGVFAATDDFGGGEGGAHLSSRIATAASELAALAVATAPAVSGFAPTESDRGAAPIEGIAEVTPFEQLLRSVGTGSAATPDDPTGPVPESP